MLQNLAKRLSQSKLGQRALAQPEGLGFLKQKPTPRFYIGVSLVLFSYFISLPALALCGYLSIRWEEPWLAVGGVIAVFIVVHLIFILGAFLAGGNYAVNTFLWAFKHFLLKFEDKNHSTNTTG